MGYAVLAFFGEMLMWQVNGANNVEYALSFSTQFFTIFIVIALAIGLSTIFSDMNKKAKRETFLMLPASDLEKFLAAVFYVTVVWALGVFLSFAIGDTLRMVVRNLFYGDAWVSGIPAMVGTMTPIGFQRIWISEIVFVVLGLVFIHSLYILGGTLLRKYAFVASSLVLIAIPVMIQYICVETGGHLNLFVVYNDVRSVSPLVYMFDVIFVIRGRENFALVDVVDLDCL